MSAERKAEEYTQYIADATARCQQLLRDFVEKQGDKNLRALEGGDATSMPALPLAATRVMVDVLSRLAANPHKLMQMQMQYYYEMARIAGNSWMRLLGETTTDLYSAGEKDRRFKDSAWTENAMFDFLKQSYLYTGEWVRNTLKEAEGVDEKTRGRADFYARQFMDALSPSNFWFSNPEVLRKVVETKGESLVRGFENLLKDMEKSSLVPNIDMTAPNAFSVGRDIAITPGKVVFQNDLLQLIQYSPSTKEVYKTPVVIVSPWINKYYILDLKPENSLIKWLVDQGHTVFITSWVNPTKKHANKGFDDYMLDGANAAIDAALKATGEEQANVFGYCIGGTLTACLLAYLKTKKQEQKVKSITFLTTLTDFSEPGELGVFIDEAQISSMEQSMAEKGYLDGDEMAFTFRMLRSNELIWSFVVNNYLLGQTPFPFDLLYWNMDSTRMAKAMHSFYLRNMYLHNKLVKPNGITLAGVKIDLRTIDTPAYMLSTELDHIAPWKSTYAATHIFKGPIRFVLSGSGHVAGIVNPPVKNKYGYWATESKHFPKSPEEWQKSTKPHDGSWWLDWQEWVTSHGFAGAKVKARTPGSGALKAIEDAPGSYVKVK